MNYTTPVTRDPDTEAPGLLESLWRFRSMALTIVVSFSLAGLALFLLFPPQATATARLALADPRGNNVFRQASSSAADLERYTGERAGFVTSGRVLETASRLLGNRLTASELDGKTKASPASNADVVVISASDESPKRAADIANAVARAYEMVSADDTKAQAAEALRAVDAARARLVAILNAAQGDAPSAVAQRQSATDALRQQDLRANEITVNAALFGAGVQYLDPARVPDTGARLVAARNVAAGGFLGLLVAVVLAWVGADRYRTADSGEDAGPVLLSPLLGEIEQSDGKQPQEVSLAEMPWEPVDSYQLVASTLRSAMQKGVLLISSSNPEDGSSVVAANLAAAAARDGRRVVLVDADNRRRTLSKLAGAQERAGLSDLVLGKADGPVALTRTHLSDGHEFSLIPAGGGVADVASLYRSEGMTEIVRRLRSSYDLVIFDGAPLLAAPETSSLVAQADGIVLIVRRGTRVHLLRRVRQHLELFATPLLGYVFTSGQEASDTPEQSELDPAVEAQAS